MLSEYTKTELEIMEMLCIDWLQWGKNFDEHRAESTLKYISYLKDEIKTLQSENDRLKDKLEIAVKALESVGKNIRHDWHDRVCGQSRGCCCSDNEAELALEQIKGKK